MKNKVNVGCGKLVAKGFHNVDMYYPEDLVGNLPKNTTYTRGAVQNLPFNDNFADYMESVDMIEHLPSRSLTKAFAEMYRVLKPEGRLCLVTTNFDDVAKAWIEESEKFTKLMKEGGDYTTMFDEDFKGDDWPTISAKSINKSMMIVYGHQSHPGEIHMNAFTPAIMYVYLLKAGFKKENITLKIHERGSLSPIFPAQEQYAEGNVGTLINDIIVAEVTK